MEFEWDDAKAASNEAKHGISFIYATRVFLASDRRDVPAAATDLGESRMVAFGTVEDIVLAVVFTLRAGQIRLI